MDKQRTFFDAESARDDEIKRAYRRTDPATSRLAAESLALDNVRARALACIRKRPGMTAREHDNLMGWDVHKRLKELEDMGLIHRGEARRCTITGRMAATWYSTEPTHD